MERVVSSATGEHDFAHAVINDNQNGQREITIMKEAGEEVEKLFVDKNWEMSVEVSSGTKYPRSRKENMLLMERMYQTGSLGDMNNLLVKEHYLRSLDVPNYRMWISLQKKTMEANAQQPPVTIAELLTNKDISKAFLDLMNALETNNTAKSQVLSMVGLSPKTDTLEDAPIQDVTSQGNVTEVSAILPQKISPNFQQSAASSVVAGSLVDNQREAVNV
jgi:hypothetical protein